MIDEKIKIYVTADVLRILQKDMEAFEFYKSDKRTLNKNAFLTKLIVNYSDDYHCRETELFNYLKKTIGAQTSLQDTRLKNLCFDISEHLNKRNAAPNKEKFDALISLKPTKESRAAIDYIEAYALEGSGLSEYFRNMFSAYAALPQDKREEIIFKPQKLALDQAISEHKRVFLSVSHDKKSSLEFSPYALTATKEELHCYVVGAEDEKCIPLRLSRIRSVTVLNKHTHFEEDQLFLFQKMLSQGPQFFYQPLEEDIVVEFTERGVEKFKKMFVHRPTPVAINGLKYTFQCSYTQAIQYFARFGADAYVVSPAFVQEKLLQFFSSARTCYQKRKNKS